MIFKKEIQHIAQLARIKITKKEEREFAKELSLILNYFKQIKRVKVKNLAPTFQQTANYLTFKTRKHKSQENRISDKNQDLLKMAPRTKNDYLKIKSVL